MNAAERTPRLRRTARGGRLVFAAIAILTAGACDSLTSPTHARTLAALEQTVLGTAQPFAVLGGSTVTNTGATTVDGDLGVNPDRRSPAFPGLLTGGTMHVADGGAFQAQNDTTTAYNTLASQALTADLTGQDLGGRRWSRACTASRARRS